MVVIAAVFVDDRRLGKFRVADAIEAGDIDRVEMADEILVVATREGPDTAAAAKK
ncbi:hypothetical protein [Ensifer sp. SL37]|uniref:hypothetical protein n=1 Tax=Ensifer sp. SL37 TaxID=2995137 RepID=UPI002273D0B7|nr:hypothetical protein [Ensifer sp. SL37]MCY1743653.1 hypothetical protein [Ensifer sp. SL37]